MSDHSILKNPLLQGFFSMIKIIILFIRPDTSKILHQLFWILRYFPIYILDKSEKLHRIQDVLVNTPS